MFVRYPFNGAYAALPAKLVRHPRHSSESPLLVIGVSGLSEKVTKKRRSFERR